MPPTLVNREEDLRGQWKPMDAAHVSGLLGNHGGHGAHGFSWAKAMAAMPYAATARSMTSAGLSAVAATRATCTMLRGLQVKQVHQGGPTPLPKPTKKSYVPCCRTVSLVSDSWSPEAKLATTIKEYLGQKGSTSLCRLGGWYGRSITVVAVACLALGLAMP